MDGCAPGPGGAIVYLNVDGKLDAVIERIPAAGGHIAIFSDLVGNVSGLHSLS